MKKFTIVLCLLLACLLGLSVGYAKEIGDYEVEGTEANTAVIMTYYGSEPNIIIPSSFNVWGDDLPLTTIQSEAFIYNTDLKSVVVPEGVDYISIRAFYGCENLETVILPSTLQVIEEEAFACCPNLKNITLPAQLYYVGANVFDGCTSLTLTESQQAVLTNTEFAADEAQQEAFVADTENLNELSVYLGTDIEAFASMMSLSNSSGSDGRGFANKDVEVYTIEHWDYIETISLRRKSNYTLCGVYAGMDSQEAMKTLLSAGWKIDNKWEIGMGFNDPNGNNISFWYDENKVVDSVVLNIDWDLCEAIQNGTKTPEDVFSYAAASAETAASTETAASAEVAASGTAHTTGDLNLRSGPGLGYDSIGVISSGKTVEYLGDSSVDDRGVTWYHISYNGKTGWGSSKFVKLD